MKKILLLFITFIMTVVLCACSNSSVNSDNITTSQSGNFTFSFDGNFNNNKDNGIILKSYGNLEFSDNSVSGKSLLFSGGYLEIGQSDKINISDTFSYSVWFKITDPAGCVDPIFFGKASSDGDIAGGPLSVHFSDNYSSIRTELTFICADDSYKSHSFASDHAFTLENITNSWNNLTVVFNKDTLTYFLNGEKLNDERIPEAIRGYKTIAGNSKPFFIGRGAIGEYQGYLDDVIFTTEILSEDEISENYEKGMSRYKNTLILSTADNKAYTAERKHLCDAIVKKDESGNTLLPVRPVVEGLGGSLSFEEFDGYGRADITIADLKSSVWIMDSNAVVNDKHIKLSSYPVFIDDVFYINLSYFSHKLGVDIKYDHISGEYILKY